MNIRLYKYLIFSLLTLSVILGKGQSFSSENNLVLSDNFMKMNLKGKVKVYKTRRKVNPEKFFQVHLDTFIKSVANNKLSYGFSNDYFWICFSIKNISPKSKSLILELDNPHIDSTYFYEILEGKSASLIGKGGDRMLFDERPIVNRRFIFPIEVKGMTTKHFAMMVDKRNASVSIPLRLWDSKVFRAHEKINNLFYLLYFGGILFVFLFSLIIGIIMKNRRLLTYSIYSGIMGFYLFIMLGFGFQYFYPQSDSFNNYIRTQMAILLLLSFIVFTLNYLQIKKSHKLSYYNLIVIIIILSILLFLSVVLRNFAFSNIVILLKIFYILIFVFFPIVIFALIKTYKQFKFQTVIYFIAIASLFTGVTVYNLIEFGIFEESLIPINPIFIGSIIELFIFSISFILEIKKINDKKNSLLKAAAEQQKNLLKAYIEGSEVEGNRISRELHDNIGSRLALIKNQLNNSGTNPEIIEKNINDMFSEVRTISNKLSPNSLHILGLVKSIQQLLNHIDSFSKIRVHFYAAKEIHLSETKSLQVYRVIQESIQNIMKHAYATQVDLQILKENDRIIITIDDNGKGFDMKDYESKVGKGLKNMKMRIESINGKIDISSQIGKGTHIMIWV